MAPTRVVAAPVVSTAEPTITPKRRIFTPKSDESCWGVMPLVVAIRTATRRNSSVYRFAIPYLLHRKHCSKETGTETGGQDHSLGSSFKCNTSGPLGIGCCDGQTKQAPQ
jgi:hypothetical protein